MTKRALEDTEEPESSSKRRRHSFPKRLDRLSDELLLRAFSFLSVPTLCRCQSVSRRFSAIAGDSQIWKQLYYNRFVRPRAARLPNLKDSAVHDTSLHFSSKLSKWLDEGGLVSRGTDTDWKRQYKLRDNWARGKCEVSEIDVAEQPPIPKMLVRLHDGVLFTVHRSGGLRAWSPKKERRLLASVKLKHDRNAVPTSLAMDLSNSADRATITRLAVGFTDGSFAVYTYNQRNPSFDLIHQHPPSTNGMVSAVAFASPYLLTITSNQRLSLYRYPTTSYQQPPQLLHSLTSQLVRPPLSLCVRQSGANIIASVAYLLPTIFQGWGVGIQELKLSVAGDLIDSRLATASGQVQHAPASPLSQSPRSLVSSDSVDSHSGLLLRSMPTSISYSHPYLLLSHSDNTLTLYLITSTTSTLSIGEGSRLWGHTSSVSGAHVGGRGKAVSVSSHGDELRVWELEGALSSFTMRKRLSAGQLSVRVQTAQQAQDDREGVGALSDAIAQRGTGLGLALKETQREAEIMKGWVGFDDESAVVLKQRADGRQALVVYDFT